MRKMIFINVARKLKFHLQGNAKISKFNKSQSIEHQTELIFHMKYQSINKTTCFKALSACTKCSVEFLPPLCDSCRGNNENFTIEEEVVSVSFTLRCCERLSLPFVIDKGFLGRISGFYFRTFPKHWRVLFDFNSIFSIERAKTYISLDSVSKKKKKKWYRRSLVPFWLPSSSI